MGGAAEAASRLRALPADATATEVLCAALGRDRRHLASEPGGAAAALASMLGEACDREALLALSRELEGARRTWWRAALSMPDGRLRTAVGLVADDYGDVAGRIRESIGAAASALPAPRAGAGPDGTTPRRSRGAGGGRGGAGGTRRTNSTDGEGRGLGR